jgi:hypothetical protein
MTPMRTLASTLSAPFGKIDLSSIRFVKVAFAVPAN